MNVYEKMNEVKVKMLDAKIKKTGINKFAGYTYFELEDIVPYIIKYCKEVNLYLQTNFTNEIATLTIINCEKPEEQIVFNSPMRELELKGCNSIQNLGGIETYERRYLLLMAFDLIEPDHFDGINGKDDKPNTYSGLTGKELDPVVKQQNLIGEEQKPVEPVELYIIEELVNRYNAVKSANDIKAQFDKMNWRDKFGNAITITKLESFFQKGWFNK